MSEQGFDQGLGELKIYKCSVQLYPPVPPKGKERLRTIKKLQKTIENFSLSLSFSSFFFLLRATFIIVETNYLEFGQFTFGC